MDANRFDAIAKAIVAESSRRRTLAGLLGGALAALGLAAPESADAARTGNCKPECGECQVCKKGKCRRTKSGRKRCKKGRCEPVENETQCIAPINGFCIDGACVCPENLEECNGLCLPICAPNVQARNPNTCVCCFVNNLPCVNDSPEGGRVPQVNANCCSNVCLPLGSTGTQGLCAPGGAGAPCNVDANCTSGDCDDGVCDGT
jgi:hypothetical protein